MTDLHHVDQRHEEIDARLKEWAAWVRVRPQGWKCQPMFRLFRSMGRQWHVPEPKVEVNTLNAHEVERAVCLMPEPFRLVIRWAYVYPYVHVGKIRREVGATDQELAAMLGSARDMVKNRLAKKLVDMEESL